MAAQKPHEMSSGYPCDQRANTNLTSDRLGVIIVLAIGGHPLTLRWIAGRAGA